MYEEIFDRYYPEIYRYILKCINQHEDAEDITQECFLRAFVHLSELPFEDKSRMRAWLFRVAINLMKDRCKSSRFRLVHMPVETQEFLLYAPDQMDAVILRDEINRLLAPLPPRRRDAFYLLSWGYTLPEIAELFKKSYDVIRVVSGRDRSQLRAIHNNLEGE